MGSGRSPEIRSRSTATHRRELGFSRITANSLDAVGDRDFALDFLSRSLASPRIFPGSEDFVLLHRRNFLMSSSPTILHR